MRLRNIPGAKDAIEESIYVIQNPQENKGSWDKVFPQDQLIHLEVGMGKGRFLMDMARLHPEINYIGTRCCRRCRSSCPCRLHNQPRKRTSRSRKRR